MHSKNLLKPFLLLVLLLSGQIVFSQSEPAVDSVLKGKDGKLVVGAEAYVQDVVFFDPVLKPTIYATNSVDNIITLRLNEFDNFYLTDSFQVTAVIRVIYTNVNNLVDSTERSLTITYNKLREYQAKAHFFFSNAYEVRVKVVSLAATYQPLNNFIHALELENLMVIDRDYKIDCSADAIQQISGDASSVAVNGELLVSWPFSRVSEEYDLEWTFIDSSALESGRYHVGGVPNPTLLFKDNATRVTVTTDHYSIPLLYDGGGTIYFRVRGAQMLANGKRNTMPWSSDFEAQGGLGQYIFTGHERKLNWQASTAFAEEGKRKTVVQYFDGSLKGRQTVTKDNTTGTTVVAETLYDKQGRPVIQVLPAPTLSQLIGFTPRFNTPADLAINGPEYDKNVYDTIINASDYCSTPAPAMSSSTSGASHYYSTQNPEASTGINQFIPNAYGFAFSETKYSADNAGRIAKQGGVGPQFVIGSGHETTYYYGAAEQDELDALFGTEVGDASHYQKNLIRDANGQYSVSYVDMHGRTVATALAGPKPANLDQLSSYRREIQLSQLLNKTNNVIKGTSLEMTKGLMVTSAGDHTFNYSLSPESLGLDDCNSAEICYDCLYDLEITITDDCNNQSLPNQEPYKYIHRNFTLSEIDTTCAAANAFSYSHTLFLNEGSYQVTKKLSVSQQAMQYYRDNIFIPHNTCRTYEDFVNEQRQIILAQIGDCTPALDSVYDYESVKSRMLQDVTPTFGQYANTENIISGGTIFSTRTDGVIPYTAAIYKDDDQSESVVMVPLPGGGSAPGTPNQLSQGDFIKEFRSSWAEALLPYHPEYGLWQVYEKLRDSHIWDEEFAKTDNLSEASSKGYLNPTYNISQPPFSGFTPNLNDPLFSIITANWGSQLSSAAKFSIEDSIRFFRKSGSTWYSLYGVASALGSCPDTDPMNAACLNGFNTTPFPSSICEGEGDMAWRFFRNMYLQIKKQYIMKFIRARAPVPYPAAPYVSVFPLIEETSMTEAGINNVWETNITSLVGGSQASLAAQRESMYADYVADWKVKLGLCGYSETQLNEVVALLLAICREGTDETHPFGASSVPPGSTAQYKSFDEAIRGYNQSIYHENCNGFLIDMPKPYSNSGLAVNKQIYSKPEDCDCARITTLNNEYQANPGTAVNFSEFLKNNYQTTISQQALDTLIGLCAGTITCKYIAKMIPLPPAMQCGNNSPCIDCGQFKIAYSGFQSRFPTLVPSFEDTSETQQKANILFRSYMNATLGFNKTTQEYLMFKDTCDATDDSKCDSLKQILEDYRKIRKELKEGKAAYGFRITPVVDEIKEGMNGLLEWKRRNSTGRYLSPRYKFQPTNYALINRFYSISHTVYSYDDSVFNMVLPLNIKYLDNSSGLFTKMLNNQVLDTTDFAGTYSQTDLDKKMYGVSLMEEWGRWRLMWSGEKPWAGVTPDCYNFSIAGYYGISAPKTKFLRDSICGHLTNGYAELAFYPQPVHITTLSQYENWRTQIYYAINKLPEAPLSHDDRLPALGLRDTLKNSTRLFQNADIRRVVDFTLDTAFLKLYISGGSTYDHRINGDFMLVTLEMMDGSTRYARFMTAGGWQLYKEYTDTIIYGSDCQKGFSAYYNSVKGTNLSYSAIQDLYRAGCGVELDICDTVLSCTKMNSLIKEYQEKFVNPASGYVDLPMRTFAGNKTPGEGPKGVFNVNNQLIAQTVSGSLIEINNSFASIWNSDPSNSVFGTLAALSDGNFRLFLKPGQLAPCNGIIGQRFYQFEENVFDSTSTVSYTSEGTYIDFGDSSRSFLKGPVYDDGLTYLNISPDPRTTLSYFNYGWKSGETNDYLTTDYKPGKIINVRHRYRKSPGYWKTYTVTVYHTDIKGVVGFNAPKSERGGELRSIKQNIRGYWPQELYKLYLESVQDSTMARTSSIYNFKQITSLQAFEASTREGATCIYDVNIESFQNNRNLQILAFERSGVGTGIPTRVGWTYSQVSGTPLYKAFPDLPINFPKLRLLSLPGYKGMERELDSTNFGLPYLKLLSMPFRDSVRSYHLDTVFNQLARVNSVNMGTLEYKHGAPYVEGYTTASDAARAKLTSQLWSIPGVNSNPSVPGNIIPSSAIIDRDSLLLWHEFSDFVNEALGTNYTYPQLQQKYQQVCGTPLQLCNISPANQPIPIIRLCGNVQGEDTITPRQPDACSDSSFLITVTATERFRAYSDSLLSSFNEAYTRKCLAASNLESFTVSRNVSEYHYTLYYYDQAGNLVKTISPAGVKPDRTAAFLNDVAAKRSAKLERVPTHVLKTTYRYNSLNQVVQQDSPDGGISRFWYDRLGRLVISQNARQQYFRQYSFTQYDALGRITTVAEKVQPLVLTTAILRNQRLLQKWMEFRNDLSTYEPKSVTFTRYDVVSTMQGAYGGATPFRQNASTLRNRVGSSTYFVDLPHTRTILAGDTTYAGDYSNYYQSSIEYSYDIHGNVDSQLNLYNRETVMNYPGHQKYKLIAYDYDLISGKVNQVHYNPDNNDEFYHRYSYDAENRLTDVYTTDIKKFVGQPSLEEHEAHYEYYKHGPLARQVIGHQQVQGVDYAYTLQGWIKGVNGIGLTQAGDMGGDGTITGMDEYAYNLNYFTGDYSAISNKNPFPEPATGVMAANYRPLYNGNINSMAVNIRQFNQPQLYGYMYDQLNRITGMNVYRGLNVGSNNWASMTSTSDYTERTSYDANGNIQKYLRRGIGATQLMDSLTYHYYPNSNQLRYISDRVNDVTHNGNYPDDLDDQTLPGYKLNMTRGNYMYDPIGNLRRDTANRTDSIRWNVYGKIEMIRKYPIVPTGSLRYVDYGYDAMGNRIIKTQYRASGDPTWSFYVRDAQGNVMAEYEKTAPIAGGPLYLKRHHLYGSSRIGLIARNQNTNLEKYSSQNMNLLGQSFLSSFERGDKTYELGNHLGNVLVTVTDKKTGVDIAPQDGIIESYNADVVTANDYYPFGMQMPGRDYNALGAADSKYGFNRKENDDHVNGEGNQQDYGMRIYDPRMGRFLSVDPLTKTYPWYTPYQFAGNKPIWATDVDGLEENTPSTYVRKTIPLLVKPTFNGIISVTDATAQTAHQTFKGNFAQLRKADQTGLGTSLVNQITGSNYGTSASALDIKMTGTRSEISKSWKGTDIKYFVQYSYSFTSNNVAEQGTFETNVHTASVSARAWDPVAFLLLNKVVSSIVITATKLGGTAVTEEMITLYRSISKAEMESIQTTRQLSFAEGQMEAKQFWQTKEGLAGFNKTFVAGEYNLEIKVPKSLLGNGKPLNTAVQVDEHLGTTATIDNAAQLNTVNQSIQSIKITPRKP
ncbi:MAG: RHS repeat-associated core domain-containing protein [Chitinophagaceae bacterium]